jgi:hypothetical protein
MAGVVEMLGMTEKDVMKLSAELFDGKTEMSRFDLAKRIIEIADGHTTKQILVLGMMLAGIRDKE